MTDHQLKQHHRKTLFASQVLFRWPFAGTIWFELCHISRFANLIIRAVLTKTGRYLHPSAPAEMKIRSLNHNDINESNTHSFNRPSRPLLPQSPKVNQKPSSRSRKKHHYPLPSPSRIRPRGIQILPRYHVERHQIR